MTTKANHDASLLLRLRFSTDPDANTFFEWKGSVFAFIPGQPPKRIFECVGMNVGKARIENGKLLSTSRELTYYLDPVTHRKLEKWENPWTGEKLPVVHIANDPVQMALPCSVPLDVRVNPFAKTTKVVTEIPLFYPNPLATEDDCFKAYDANKMYQAGELFTFSCPSEQVTGSQDTIENVEVNWTRISRFPPFMKMGHVEGGYLVYHCTGHKLPQGSTFNELTEPILRQEIATRMMTFANAPPKYDPAAKSVSSWSYFRDHFHVYEAHPDTVWPLTSDFVDST